MSGGRDFPSLRVNPGKCEFRQIWLGPGFPFPTAIKASEPWGSGNISDWRRIGKRGKREKSA